MSRKKYVPEHAIAKPREAYATAPPPAAKSCDRAAIAIAPPT